MSRARKRWMSQAVKEIIGPSPLINNDSPPAMNPALRVLIQYASTFSIHATAVSAIERVCMYLILGTGNCQGCILLAMKISVKI